MRTGWSTLYGKAWWRHSPSLRLHHHDHHQPSILTSKPAYARRHCHPSPYLVVQLYNSCLATCPASLGYFATNRPFTVTRDTSSEQHQGKANLLRTTWSRWIIEEISVSGYQFIFPVQFCSVRWMRGQQRWIDEFGFHS